MKLEVGKSYRNGQGDTVKIVHNDWSTVYPCLGDRGQAYTEDGHFWSHRGESDENLIEEVKMSKELEPNTIYTAKSGKKVLILEKTPELMSLFGGLLFGGSYFYIGIIKDPASNYTATVKSYQKNGFCILDEHDISLTKTITIDGKVIEISDDSFEQLKRSLLDE